MELLYNVDRDHNDYSEALEIDKQSPCCNDMARLLSGAPYGRLQVNQNKARLHMGEWEWNLDLSACPSCGETVTVKEVIHE